MNNTLGTVTTCHGGEHRYLRDCQVRIGTVIKGAIRDDYDVDAGGGYLTDEECVARRGGVTADGRVEGQPWIEKKGRYSFVFRDLRAVDLACFASLGKPE